MISTVGGGVDIRALAESGCTPDRSWEVIGVSDRGPTIRSDPKKIALNGHVSRRIASDTLASYSAS